MPRFETVKVERCGAGKLDELRATPRNLGEREPLGRADHGNDESLRRRHCEADVRRRESE
jgi:hypothetical protein